MFVKWYVDCSRFDHVVGLTMLNRALWWKAMTGWPVFIRDRDDKKIAELHADNLPSVLHSIARLLGEGREVWIDAFSPRDRQHVDSCFLAILGLPNVASEVSYSISIKDVTLLETCLRHGFAKALVEDCQATGAFFGNCALAKHRVVLQSDGSMPGRGLNQLDWQNWFGSCYRGVFRDTAFDSVPFVRHDTRYGECYFLQLGESPKDYFSYRTRRLAIRYRNAIGQECFTTYKTGPIKRLLREWVGQRLLFGPLQLWGRDAKKVPDIPALRNIEPRW